MNRALSLNQFQLTSALYNARAEIDICNRGVGKTTNFAIKSEKVAHVMPRGKSAFVNRTYKNALDKTIPPIVEGWKQLGYVEDVHFVVRKTPPKAWPKPIAAPLDYSNTITWYTGHLFFIVSQERADSFRGPSIDFVFADEGLSLHQERFEKEVLAARRGNKVLFEKVGLHYGLHIASSKPYGSEGRWLLDYGNYYTVNGDDFQLIRNKIADVALEIIDARDVAKRKELWQEYLGLKRQLKVYPDKESGYLYLESCPFDNLENLGFQYFVDLRKTMSLFRFKVEMLNWTPSKVDKGFYPDLDISKHTYDAINYSHLEAIGYSHKNKPQQDCRFDSDVDTNAALWIGLDYGGSHNCMWVNQPRQGETRWINYLYNLHPLRTKDVVQSFCDYYKHHSHKHTYYAYDHTAIGNDGKSDSYKDIVISCLKSNGWSVNPIYIGRTPDPFKRYELAGKALRGQEGMPKQKFNRQNCKQGLTSLELTGTKQGTKGLEKNKACEKEEEYPQEDAPHGADAFDTLLWAQLANWNPNREPADTIYG